MIYTLLEKIKKIYNVISNISRKINRHPLSLKNNITKQGEKYSKFFNL